MIIVHNMANANCAILIVGSDSFIGSALMTYLQHAGQQVIGTTRRREAVDATHCYLDLMMESKQWQCPESVTVAVVCAGVTKINACKIDPIGSARININETTALIQELVERGIFVIYLSTNNVFDGSMPYRQPNDSISPINEYGRQKAAVEQRIRRWGKSVAIVRMTKVMDPTLFVAWSTALKKNEVINPFVDMVMAPVPLAFVVTVLRLLAEVRLSGIWHISGGYDISYADAALLGAQLLGVNVSLVQPIEARSGGMRDALPLYTTLNTDNLKRIFGIESPDVRWTLQMAFTHPQVLSKLKQ